MSSDDSFPLSPTGPASASDLPPQITTTERAPILSHHHTFFTIILNDKLVSMPCECGITWEENFERAINRYHYGPENHREGARR